MANEYVGAKNLLELNTSKLQGQSKMRLVRVEPGYEYFKNAEGRSVKNDTPSYVKVVVLITEDYSNDFPNGDGPNQWSKLVVKLEVPYTEGNVRQLDQLIGRDVVFADLTGSVYGNFGNQLSLRAKSLKVQGNESKDKV